MDAELLTGRKGAHCGRGEVPGAALGGALRSVRLKDLFLTVALWPSAVVMDASGLERSRAARGCHMATYLFLHQPDALQAGGAGSAFSQSPPTGSGQTGDLLQNWEMCWPDRTSGLQSKHLRVQKRKLGAREAMCPDHGHRARWWQHRPRTLLGGSESCPLHKSQDVNSPNVRPEILRTPRPDLLLHTHTPKVHRIFFLESPSLKAMCPHPSLPGPCKTRDSVYTQELRGLVYNTERTV